MVKLAPTSGNLVHAAYIETDYLTAHRYRPFDMSTRGNNSLGVTSVEEARNGLNIEKL